VRVALGVWRFTPSHFLTLPRICDVILGLPLGPHPCNLFALVVSPKLGLRQCPFTPPKCCKLGSVPWFLALLLFFVWKSHLSPSRSWECITNSQSGCSLGSVRVHSLPLSYTPKSMRCDSQASLLAHNLVSPFLGREPKARVTICAFKASWWPIVHFLAFSTSPNPRNFSSIRSLYHLDAHLA